MSETMNYAGVEEWRKKENAGITDPDIKVTLNEELKGEDSEKVEYSAKEQELLENATKYYDEAKNNGLTRFDDVMSYVLKKLTGDENAYVVESKNTTHHKVVFSIDGEQYVNGQAFAAWDKESEKWNREEQLPRLVFAVSNPDKTPMYE